MPHEINANGELRRELFRILSYSGMRRAVADIARAVVPIYGDRNHRAIHIGSGILLQYETMHFIATAAHITDECRDTKLYVPPLVGPLLELRGDAVATTAPNGDRKQDKLDIALVRLPPELVSKLGSRRYIQAGECTSTAATKSDHHCMVFGYPNSINNDIDHAKKTVRIARLSFGGKAKPDERMSKRLSLEGDHHLLIRYTTKVQDERGNRKRANSPRGISGGAAFDLGRIGNILSTPRLAGLFIEYHQEHSCAVATRIERVLDVLRQGLASGKFD